MRICEKVQFIFLYTFWWKKVSTVWAKYFCKYFHYFRNKHKTVLQLLVWHKNTNINAFFLVKTLFSSLTVVLLHLDGENLTSDWANVFILDTFDVDDNSVRITSEFAVLEWFLTQNAITEKKKKKTFFRQYFKVWKLFNSLIVIKFESM